jgi:hypothetical protein
MKFIRPLLAFAMLTAMAGTPAWADHGHYHGRAHVGVVIGGPGYWRYPDPYFYPPYPYGYPPVVVVPAQPQTYIEQAPAPAAQPSNDWYYCRTPEGYYPYVKQCPGGWQRVAPQPPQP